MFVLQLSGDVHRKGKERRFVLYDMGIITRGRILFSVSKDSDMIPSEMMVYDGVSGPIALTCLTSLCCVVVVAGAWPISEFQMGFSSAACFGSLIYLEHDIPGREECRYVLACPFVFRCLVCYATCMFMLLGLSYCQDDIVIGMPLG